MKPMIYGERISTPEILDSGCIDGYKYCILSLGSHPTAYISLPPDSKVKSVVNDCKDDLCNIISVHGGWTFGPDRLSVLDTDDLYYGWDYAHCDDYIYYPKGLMEFPDMGLKKWTTEEVLDEVEHVIHELNGIEGRIQDYDEID